MLRFNTISSKILFFHAAMLAVALAASTAAIYFFTAGFLKDNARESNRDAARLADDVIARDIEQAALFSRLVAENYQIKVALTGMPGSPIAAKFDIKQQLLVELGSLPADFISVARADGVVFAHEEREGEPRGAAPLRNEPLFLSPAFQRCERSKKTAVGVEPVYPGTLSVVAVSPIESSDGKKRTIGYLRLGYKLDRQFVRQIRDVTMMHVAVLNRDEIVASTLPTGEDAQGNPVPPTTASLKKNYILHDAPIRSGGETGASIITAYPLSRLRAVQRGTVGIIVLVALAVFALSIPVAARLSSVIVAPLKDLMAGVSRVESGDLETRIPECGTDEICMLADSFNKMTDSLSARNEEIRRNRDQLIESGKLAAIGELSAGVAHEIGNPLAAISGYIQLLRGQLPPEKTAHFLGEMEREVGFIDSIIRELLDFSRPSRIEEAVVDINSTVEESLRMLSFHSAMRPVTTKTSLAPDSPETLGSRKELLQALMNLTLNAAQSMPDGGEVRIAVETSKGIEGAAPIVKISVSDNGPGIPEDMLDKIFDPFFTTKRGGTGLGLSITYRIVYRHQGEIRVSSKPGEGTTFTIALPLAEKS